MANVMQNDYTFVHISIALVSIFAQFIFSADAHQCDLKKMKERDTPLCHSWLQGPVQGYSLIQSGSPLFHMGLAYITSEIQWYSPLTQSEKLQG